MLVKELGAIDKILLPPEFAPASKEYGGRGDNWLIQFSTQSAVGSEKPEEEEEEVVQICFLYRGRASDRSDTETLRRLTARSAYSQGNQLLKADQVEPAAEDLELLFALFDVLGNVGDNQYTRKCTARATGLSGAGFHLQSLELMTVSTRTMLAARGYYHDFKGQPNNYYKGVFFDAAAAEPLARIEEIYIQSKNAEIFERYLPAFDRCLATIQWLSVLEVK